MIKLIKWNLRLWVWDLNDDILDEFYRIQELMSKQYISKDRWHSYPLSHSTERISSYNILWQEPGPFHFVKRMCDSILSSFMAFVHCNLLDSKWENTKGRFVHKDDWRELDDAEMRKCWTDHPNWCWLMWKNIFPQNHDLLKVLKISSSTAVRCKRSQSNNKLEPLRDLFEHMTINEQLVVFRGCCPFQVYIPSKPGKYGIKIEIWCI